MISRWTFERVAREVNPALGERLDARRIERAGAHRRALDHVAFIGVTGSSGKTTTKELIAAVLSTRMRGTKSIDSLNRPSAVARTILQTEPDAGFAVAEVSATFPGMVSEAAALLRPRIAVVTTIGQEHYKSFRSREATAAEKGMLVEALPEDGTAVLNADDPYVAAMAERTRARVVTYGATAGATFRAEDVRAAWPDRLTFTVRHDGRAYPVRTKLYGKQWTTAALAALAVGHVLGVPLETGIEAVEALPPISGRMNVVEHDGVTFVRDDWKAPLWSFDRVLDFVAEARAARKVLVIGTISDYAGGATRTYTRVAARAIEVADEVIFVGPQARHALKAKTGPDTGVLRAYPSVREAADHLRATVRSGDLVVVKASVSDHLLRVILAQRERVRCWRQACGRPIFCDGCQLRRVPGSISAPLDAALRRSLGTTARR